MCVRLFSYFLLADPALPKLVFVLFCITRPKLRKTPSANSYKIDDRQIVAQEKVRTMANDTFIYDVFELQIQKECTCCNNHTVYLVNEAVGPIHSSLFVVTVCVHTPCRVWHKSTRSDLCTCPHEWNFGLARGHPATSRCMLRISYIEI
jgi:hypothetical protein